MVAIVRCISITKQFPQFDVHALFDLLDQYDIRSGIKIRKNAGVDEDGNGS
ncbi:TPA: hypothetical protein HA361_03195 [Candidatus Woesearchaeota archaeon]|nr:hypothetical protein [Candidatus Woesearchaeota archaeon]